MPIYQIIEVANTHAGEIEYLKKLINEFSDLKDGFGIKFQPLSASTIATSDFEWYNVYEELFFEPKQWEDIIERSASTKDVWIDLFDTYGTQILEQNLENIVGIKFQSSVLGNLNLFNSLKKIDLREKKIILNIAARKIEEIEDVIKKVQKDLNPHEILLEIGFQGYPTELEDSGLNKISILKEKFPYKLVFADHSDGKSEHAIWLPVVAANLGVDVLEKHVRLDQETKYDHFSSLTPERYKKMVSLVDEYFSLYRKPFINKREIEYLKKSLMIPILGKDISKGEIISIQEDLDFRRSSMNGLDIDKIKNYLENFYIISQSKKKGETLNTIDFKKATIATIIACRLKSSRLPKKALLKIGELSSVEYCISNCMKFKNTNHTILATSTLESDSDLKNHTFSDQVIFHRGDPEDVIQRYLDICEELKIDVFVRVTADMPFVDDEICQTLLKSHFLEGADYTTVKDAAVGTNLEIINVAALKRVKDFFPYAEYSEYMTWYFQNNPNYFKINKVDLPEELVRSYRLTLDYKEDLEMFNLIDQNFPQNEFTLRDIFEFLDTHPEISKINNHLKLKYKTDQELISTLNRETKINQ